MEEPPADQPAVEDPPVDQTAGANPPLPEDEEEDERAEFREELDAAFGGDKFDGQARATANRFATLAKHIADVVPKSQAQTVALRKLIKARNAVIRALASS
ncbi:hypothetical protein CNY89_16695 [Amaricoccus sp. HAR-UPW-R2A-40]|nr:hypothetical protein CNY89_16695 [Amaricoccus sp. HAR-UPW-R2A-40]